jgi:hypothetical protein
LLAVRVAKMIDLETSEDDESFQIDPDWTIAASADNRRLVLKLAEMFPPTSVIGVIWIIRAIDHGGDPDLREAVRFLELEKQSNGEIELSSYSRIRKWMDSVTGVEFDGISIEKAGRLVYIRRVGD